MTIINWIIGKVLDLLFGEAEEFNYNPDLLRPNPLQV